MRDRERHTKRDTEEERQTGETIGETERKRQKVPGSDRDIVKVTEGIDRRKDNGETEGERFRRGDRERWRKLYNVP